MSPKNKTCGGCFRKIEDRRRCLSCHTCKKHYDLVCAGVTEQRFHGTLVGEHRDRWRCVACVSAQPKRDNTNTPVRAAVDDGVTLRRGASSMSPVGLDVSMLEGPALDDTAHNATVEMPDFHAFVLEMRQFREEVRAMHTRIDAVYGEIRELTGRVIRCEEKVGAVEQRLHVINLAVQSGASAGAARIDALEQRLGAGAARMDAFEQRLGAGAAPGPEASAQLERTVAELRLELNERDQEALLADLEIGHLPEAKGESVVHSVAVLASRLGVALDERDVVFAERVGAPPAEAGGRARRVVVRLARRRLRDELLQAARVRRGLAGEGGARVFINERLTRPNRQLFHRVREECRRLQWRYSWTKNGRIFARRGDGAQAYQLRSMGDLERVFGLPPS